MIADDHPTFPKNSKRFPSSKLEDLFVSPRGSVDSSGRARSDIEISWISTFLDAPFRLGNYQNCPLVNLSVGQPCQSTRLSVHLFVNPDVSKNLSYNGPLHLGKVVWDISGLQLEILLFSSWPDYEHAKATKRCLRNCRLNEAQMPSLQRKWAKWALAQGTWFIFKCAWQSTNLQILTQV